VIAPNLAGRPFLNTRPVWLVTAVAAVLTFVLIVMNVGFFVRTNRTLEPQIEYRDRLIAEERALAAEVGGVVETLEGVPWKSLESRVHATNLVLREHAFSWLELLDDVARVMPYDVRITKITPDVGPNWVTLHLIVVARTRDDMLEFLGNLVDDPRFSNPTPRQEQGPEEASFPGYTLALSVRYAPQGEVS
jgi:hypothetical protein